MERIKTKIKTSGDVLFTGNKVIIRTKKLSDAEDDYTWESDRELAELDAVYALTIPFSRYLSEYSSELRRPYVNSRYFGVDTLDGKHIGNCSYYHFDEAKGETELGIMIGNRDYWDKGYGKDTVTALVDYIFRATEINRIYLKTLEANYRAQKCFEKSGFVWCGRLLNTGTNFMLMEMSRKQWQTNASP
ncbi:MAG: GNAT family N-acetyltransferase [Dehalococcoidales bacterium]|nr:GNAT family N-acetyltransferase [Dehalococcoidales bacterium]